MSAQPNVSAKPRITRRVMAAQPSASMALEARIGEMRAAGEPVISFGAGEPDFPTPDAIKLNGHEAIDTNLTKYTPAGGTVGLHKAIAARMKAEPGLDYKNSQINITNGGKEAIYLAMQALVEAGDEVIIPAPYWVSYPEMVRLADGVPIIIPTTVKDNFKVTPEMLLAHTTPNTRMFVLVSPSNPTRRAAASSSTNSWASRRSSSKASATPSSRATQSPARRFSAIAAWASSWISTDSSIPTAPGVPLPAS